ncbi:cold-shock protein [Maritimibacter sp. DP07]|uniref:Cold-shock protein n=1 Tax=Maritimibacter harenae TaxID=2606218 RepID=A0A845M6N0_9RHOB|nr:cold shock domain-containing protein [Maritimibacter harenae]MZR13387.1 cold-shock protein [Maritimibacter harenae]
MTHGTVKWFNTQNGFGFIQPENGENEVYLPGSAIEDAGLERVEIGQNVSFEIEADSDGRNTAGDLEVR